MVQIKNIHGEVILTLPEGEELYEAVLVGEDLHEADLRGADLSMADLTDADLTGADLTDADLSCATTIGTRFDEAILDGAVLLVTLRDIVEQWLLCFRIISSELLCTLEHKVLQIVSQACRLGRIVL